MKRLDKDIFYARCMEKHHGKYSYHDDFISTHKKIRITCPIHGDFQMTGKNHLKGQGCPICGSEYAKTHSKGQYQHFLDNCTTKFGDIFTYPNISDEYENENSQITIVCNKCGTSFQKRAQDHKNSPHGGCPICRKQRVNKSRTYFSYNELASKFPSIPLLPFQGTVIKEEDPLLKCQCQVHGEYQIRLHTILDNRGKCKKCSQFNSEETTQKRKIEFDNFIKQTYGNKFQYDIEQYVNRRTAMHFKCNDCGLEFDRTPSAWISNIHGSGCLNCSNKQIGEKNTKTTEEFIQEAQKIFSSNQYDYTDTVYTKRNESVSIKCNQCGRTFTINAGSHLQGHGCPYHYCNKSKQEEELLEYIRSIYTYTIHNNDRSILDGDEIDIVLPDIKLGIEFDGVYWHNELNKPKTYHIDKTLRCQKRGYKLIHVFEDEWRYKKDIVKSRIASACGVYQIKLYARQCEIREVDSSIATDFLNSNHLQGNAMAKYKIGLFFNDELVSLMTFGKTRIISKAKKNPNEFELIRFASKLNTIIIGGASKLLSYFIKTYHPSSIISYADRRWSIGNLYEKLGFTLQHLSQPSYYYVIDGKCHNRFNFRKDVLVKEGYDPSKTEHEIMVDRGIYRIYDCGALCYTMNLENS